MNSYAIHKRAKGVILAFLYWILKVQHTKEKLRKYNVFFRTGLVSVILVLCVANCSTDGTIQDNDQIDASFYGIAAGRHWTKRSISKATVKGASKLKGFWRVTMARDVLLHSTKFQKKIGNVKVYSKPGGWIQVDKDIIAMGLADVKRIKDHEGYEVLFGTVADARIKLAYGDDLANVGYPTVTMFGRNTPQGTTTTVKVYYTDTAPRIMKH